MRSALSIDRLAAWAAPRRGLVDAVWAVLLGGLSLVAYATADRVNSERPHDAVGVVVIVAISVAFAFRRSAPLRSACAVVAGTLAFWVLDYPTNFDGFALFAIYSMVAHGGPARRRVWSVAAALIAALTTVAVIGVLAPQEDLPAIAIVGVLTITLTAAIIGEMVYTRRLRVAELEERTHRAEAERELLAREAVMIERTRIAHDLHDIVAHGVTVMVVQAAAARRLLATQPEHAAAALDHVQQAGRDALVEMRRMLGVLRSEQPAELVLGPQPSLDDLAAVVERCDDAGVATTLVVDGSPRWRSPGAELVAYRVVQEALTNVIKHAGRPARASVRVTYVDDHVRVEIDDDGSGARQRDVDRGTGHGLVGMRQRVELYRGRFAAGPRPGGGFRVSATIPLIELGDPAPVAVEA